MESSSEIEQLQLEPTIALDKRVLEVVRQCPDLKIKPARLASELGLSIEDASAELCGLLRAVGSTATFTFETVVVGEESNGKITTTMVFQFPNDFEQKANSCRRKEDLKEVAHNIMLLIVKILKVVVAFGLVISLAILLVAGICAIVAAIIALSRGGHGRQNNQRLVNHMRSMFLTLRQILWFYAIFGEGLDNGQDPFLRETAHTMALGLSMLLGSPRSIWFWMNARRFRDRRQQRRGWNLRTPKTEPILNRSESTERTSSSYNENHRGILSVAVEFLFGPSPFWPPPSEFDTWKVREHAIIQISTKSKGNGVALRELLPYTDNPPSIQSYDGTGLSICGMSDCLKIVSHFNGVPIGGTASEPWSARFAFPEIMSEASSDYTKSFICSTRKIDTVRTSWQSFFVTEENAQLSTISYSTGQNDTVLNYHYEESHVLTKLSRHQFGQCCILNALNYIGILMLQSSILKGGLLEIKNAAFLSVARCLLSLLKSYALLFFVIPFCRALILSAMNFNIKKRNERRQIFAKILKDENNVQ